MPRTPRLRVVAVRRVSCPVGRWLLLPPPPRCRSVRRSWWAGTAGAGLRCSSRADHSGGSTGDGRWCEPPAVGARAVSPPVCDQAARGEPIQSGNCEPSVRPGAAAGPVRPRSGQDPLRARSELALGLSELRPPQGQPAEGQTSVRPGPAVGPVRTGLAAARSELGRVIFRPRPGQDRSGPGQSPAGTCQTSARPGPAAAPV